MVRMGMRILLASFFHRIAEFLEPKDVRERRVIAEIAETVPEELVRYLEEMVPPVREIGYLVNEETIPHDPGHHAFPSINDARHEKKIDAYLAAKYAALSPEEKLEYDRELEADQEKEADREMPSM
jgi:hypothetical protein